MVKFVTLPLVFPLVCSIIVYAIGLPILESNPYDLGASITVAIIWYTASIGAAIMMWYFVRAYYYDKHTIRESLIGFFNCLYVAGHVVAAIGMTIWLFDTSPSKDTIFSNIDTTKSQYGIFVFYFSATAFNFMVRSRLQTIEIVDYTILGSFWFLFGGFVGLLITTLLFVFVSRSITRNIRVAHRN